MNKTDYLIWGVFWHLMADWILQNEWMALNKGSLRHPAAWVHGGIHALLMLLVFPWWAALIIGISHMVIDTRAIAMRWQSLFGQTTSGPFALPVALWLDQVLHVAIIGILTTVVP